MLFLIIGVFFETLQQLYYVEKFNLYENISYNIFFLKQTLSWIIWFSLTPFIYFFNKNNKFNHLSSKSLIKHILFIFSIVFLCIILISITRLLIDEGKESTFQNLFSNYFPFFIFQKAPIYTLTYIGISMISNLDIENLELKIELQELIDLKNSNIKAYNDLKSNNDNKAKILNIKIGNNHKIILVDDINWIEADDYCVKIHLQNSKTYTMRSSLKALEEKLKGNFLRVHRKAIVNMDVVKELKLTQTPILVLQNNEKIQISKSNLKTVKEFISK